jgi:hypothetical protein
MLRTGGEHIMQSGDHVTVSMQMARKETTDTFGTPSKMVLFCPDCDFESGMIGGDWAVSSTDGETIYDCPECHHSFSVSNHR